MQEKRQLVRTILALYPVPKYWPLKYNIVGKNVDLLPYRDVYQTLEGIRDNSLWLFIVQKETLYFHMISARRIHDAIRNISYLGASISLGVGLTFISLAMFVSKVRRRKLDFLGLSKPTYSKTD